MGRALTELARISDAPRAHHSHGIPELDRVNLVTGSDGSGRNCADRALAALSLCPDARAVIGSVILRGGRCLRTGERMHSCKPWGHHIWLIRGGRGFHDPSISNLATWAERQQIELPRPMEQMTAQVMLSRRAQAGILEALTAPRPRPLPADLIYLPGLVFTLSWEEVSFTDNYIHAWGKLARESVRAGGWSAEQLGAALARVDALMAEEPTIRSTEVAA